MIGSKVLGDIMGSSVNSYGTLFNNLQLMKEASDCSDNIHYQGICGETAAHISVYKGDLNLVDIILKHGFDPNTKNMKDETILQSAVRLGDIDIVRLIYATKKCDLDVKNRDGMTAYDLTQVNIEERELFELRVFRNWDRNDGKDLSISKVLAGRKNCEIFLKDKLEIDRLAKTNQIMDDTITYNSNRTKCSRIIKGINADQNYRSYTDLSYPTYATKSWPVEDIHFFEKGWGFSVGFKLVITRIYACEYVNFSLNVGFDYAQKSILLHLK